jgi:hypothetical protein
MRRPFVVLIAIAAVGAIAAPPASAAPGCSTPSGLTWHSCLNAGHRKVLNTDNVRLTKATAVLVVRMTACPADVPSRRVVIRTEKRKRVARERVEGTCKHNVARWRLRIKPHEFDVPAGTVIHSYWSGIDDADDPPGVKLGKKKS